MNDQQTPLAGLLKVPSNVATFRIALSLRKQREKLRILVVEDQLFSQRILGEILHHNHIVDITSSAREGLQSYLEQAPDIALLDIELMDESSHSLAKIIKSIDPESYVVMVSSNNSVEDVTFARGNKVDGFIVKPYNKSKVLECIDKYLAIHPDRQPKGNKP